MRNKDQLKTLINVDLTKNKNFEGIKIKTTNVNILLNRVRLDKKKDFQKKIIFFSLLVSVIFVVTLFVTV